MPLKKPTDLANLVVPSSAAWEVEIDGMGSCPSSPKNAEQLTKSPVQRRLEKRIRSPKGARDVVAPPSPDCVGDMPFLDLGSSASSSPVLGAAKKRREDLLEACSLANGQKVARAKAIARKLSQERQRDSERLAMSIESKLRAAEGRREELLAERTTRAASSRVSDDKAEEEQHQDMILRVEAKLQKAEERREEEFERRMEHVRQHLKRVRSRCDQLRMVRRMQSWWREVTLRKKIAVRFLRSGPQEQLEVVFGDQLADSAAETEEEKEAQFDKLVEHLSDQRVIKAAALFLDSLKPRPGASKTPISSARSFLASLMILKHPATVLGIEPAAEQQEQQGKTTTPQTKRVLRTALQRAAHNLMDLCVELSKTASNDRSRRVVALLRLLRAAHLQYARAFARWKQVDALCLSEELLVAYVAIKANLEDIEALIEEDEANAQDPGVQQHLAGNLGQLESIESRVLKLLGQRQYGEWLARAKELSKGRGSSSSSSSSSSPASAPAPAKANTAMPRKPNTKSNVIPSNEAMVHELVLDSTFALPDPKEQDESELITSFAHELENGRFQPLLDIVASIKGRIGALTPNRADLLRQLDDRLDVQLLDQMLRENVFGVKELYALVAFIGEQLLALQAPARQTHTEAWLIDLHEKSQDKAAKWTTLAPSCFSKVLHELALLDVDLANYHLKVLGAHLQGKDGIEYLRSKFAARVQQGEYQRGSSGQPLKVERWLAQSFERINASREAALAEAHAAASEAASSVPASTSSSPRHRQATLQECLIDAWLGILFDSQVTSSQEILAAQLLPETLREFDAERLFKLNSELASFSLLAVLRVVVSQVLAVHEKARLEDTPQVNDELHALAFGNPLSSEDLCANVIRVADQAVVTASAGQKTGLSDASRQMLTVLVSQSSTSPLAKTVRRQFESIIRKAINAPAHSCDQLLRKIGLDAWKSQVFDLCKRILAVFELNQSVHAPVYLSIFTYLKKTGNRKQHFAAE